MTFQIQALPESLFSDLFALSDAELMTRACRRMIVNDKPGFPCRVSLADAEIGETVVLVNYEHLPEHSPYRSSHAIFVRQGVKQYIPQPGEVPQVLQGRLLSVRAFDGDHLMRAADVVDGQSVDATINKMFADPAVAYLHLHNAKPGCFAASVLRV